MKVDGLDPQTLKALSDAIKTVRKLKSVFNPDQIDLISQAIASVQKMLPENWTELNTLFNQINETTENTDKPKQGVTSQISVSKKTVVKAVDINAVINLLLLLISMFGLVIELSAQKQESTFENEILSKLSKLTVEVQELKRSPSQKQSTNSGGSARQLQETHVPHQRISQKPGSSRKGNRARPSQKRKTGQK